MISDAADPTGLGDLRAAFNVSLKRRWSKIAADAQRAIRASDSLGLGEKAPFGLPMADRAKQFSTWLDERLYADVLGFDGGWAQTFVKQAAGRATLRADRLMALQATEVPGVNDYSPDEPRNERGEWTGQTATPEFKAWFGNSKVVDESGKPRVMYHGTDTDILSFRTVTNELGAHFGTATQANSIGETTGNRTGGRIYPVYLSIKNPLRLRDVGRFDAEAVAPQLEDLGFLGKGGAEKMYQLWTRGGDAASKALQAAIKKAGYDGVVYLNRREGTGRKEIEGEEEMSDEEFRKAAPQAEDSYIAFRPEQIKSAIGNKGTFSRRSGRITDAFSDSLPILSAATADELEGICDAVGQQATRAVTMGMINRRRPKQIADSVRKVISDVGYARSKMLAEHYVTMGFSHATLDALERAGVTHVKMVAEKRRFEATDAGPPTLHAAGVMFYDPDGRALFLHRTDGAGWAFPGGGIEPYETPENAAIREAQEEVGGSPMGQLEHLTEREHDGVHFTTFLQPVTVQFEPHLNEEHDDHVWAPLSDPPQPLHPGVAWTLAQAGHPQPLGDAARNTPQPQHPRTGQFAKANVVARETAREKSGRFGRHARQISPRERRLAEQREPRWNDVRGLQGVLTAEDDRVCPTCQSIAEMGPYTINKARSLIPAHPNAVLEGSTFASYGPAHEMARARFMGPAKQIRTTTKSFTIGPNHPMLTKRGFVRAADLKKGDELLYDLRVEGEIWSPSEADLENMPSVEDVFEASRPVSTRFVAPSACANFHGDETSCYGEVEAIHSARLLSPIFDPSGIEKFSESVLPLTSADLEFVASLRSSESDDEAIGLASSLIMSGRDLSFAGVGSHVAPLDKLLLGGRSTLDPGPRQDAVDHGSACVVELAQSEDALAENVSAADRRDFIYRWDAVLDVRHVWFQGWAFDASTASQLYLSDGYVVHNCRCLIVPAEMLDVTLGDFDPEEPRNEQGEWTTTGSTEVHKPKTATFYHGSSAEAVASIKARGLIPHGSEGADAWYVAHGGSMQTLTVAGTGAKKVNAQRAGSVFITDDLDTAKSFANLASNVHGRMGAAVLKVEIPPDQVKNIVHDELAGSMPAYRFHGKIDPKWISVLAETSPWQDFPTKWKIAPPHQDAEPPLTLYLVVRTDEADGLSDFDPDEPRDPKGEWTAGGGIVAYHGSPHDFAKFDLAHMGTGEGSLGVPYASFAGDYGHGLYFAEERATAERYQEETSPRHSWDDPIGGNLYQVRIHAKPEEFLDWDKKEQSDLVARALDQLTEGKVAAAGFTGKEAYRDLARHASGAYKGGEAEASQRLRSLGVKGIRYLDQLSRKVGHGTSNYVIFDPSILEITHKNGTPLTKSEAKDALAEMLADFDPDEPRDPAGRWTALEGSQGHPALISTRPVTAVGTAAEAKSAALAQRNVYKTIDLAAMKADPEAFKANVDLLRDARFYPGMSPSETQARVKADDLAKVAVERMKSNLEFLVGQQTKEFVATNKRWYDGAHKIAQKIATDSGIDIASASGVVAALSPQTDWDRNVYMAKAVSDSLTHRMDYAWDSDMERTAQAIWKRGKGANDNSAFIPMLRDAKTLRSLSKGSDPDAANALMGMWIRTYDEAHGSRQYRSITAEGDEGDFVRTKGEKAPKTAMWGTTSSIANAIASYRSGGDANKISDSMGDRHKVRSFYNNILDPDSPNGDVTIDTHAVGAAWLQPYTGKDVSVLHALNTSPQKKDKPEGWVASKGSAVTGVKGTYGLYAQAYREAASDLHMLPRQLQSVVWVAKRDMFSEDATGSVMKRNIDQVWRRFNAGELDIEAAQKEVMKVARETKAAAK